MTPTRRPPFLRIIRPIVLRQMRGATRTRLGASNGIGRTVTQVSRPRRSSGAQSHITPTMPMSLEDMDHIHTTRTNTKARIVYLSSRQRKMELQLAGRGHTSKDRIQPLLAASANRKDTVARMRIILCRDRLAKASSTRVANNTRHELQPTHMAMRTDYTHLLQDQMVAWLHTSHRVSSRPAQKRIDKKSGIAYRN